jgi:7,8-dihydropterin-6-yl-methyl-4-(beta-D-ribofuranosyl)aminobenzene 5'-phosphate synthase
MLLRLCIFAAFLALISTLSGNQSFASPGNRVTILYDAFGEPSALTKDWGFAALVEYHGKRILFDTGNNAEVFAHNVAAAGVDLGNLDFAVISHRHLDHAAGLPHLLAVNPGVKIYVPKEAFGNFGSSLPAEFYRKEEMLPESMRYFDGRPPETLRFGTAWTGATFVPLDKTTEVAPGIFILALVSEVSGTRELRELSLAIDTPEGVILIVGCSHPGIEKILEAATAIDGHIRIVFGGLHLPAAPDEQISRVGVALHEVFKVERLAPGHCTGEPAFASFGKMWGRNYVYAGLGSVIELP